jgi:geranylgeranyl diphosphate synthase, type II
MINSFGLLQQRVSQAIVSLPLPGSPANLYEPVSYTLALSGKRLRPLLVLMACDMFEGNLEEAIHPAIGLELFHNFTLLHDDIMDQAPLRRGRETVYKKWNPNIAILSGDTMFAMANREMLKTQNEAIALVGELFNNTAIEVCEGQQVDVDFEFRDDVTIPEYLEMIRLKTAVLLACSLKTGAIIAGASDNDQQLIYDAGINLGMAFQLKDDYLDTFGDEKTFGKTPGGDILAGKKTFLFLKLLEKAGPDREKLRKLYSPGSTLKPTEKVKLFTSQFLEKEIPGEIELAIHDYFNKVFVNIDLLDVIPERKTVLLDFIQSLVSREK